MLLNIYFSCMSLKPSIAAAPVKSTTTAISTPAGEGRSLLRQGLLHRAALLNKSWVFSTSNVGRDST